MSTGTKTPVSEPETPATPPASHVYPTPPEVSAAFPKMLRASAQALDDGATTAEEAAIVALARNGTFGLKESLARFYLQRLAASNLRGRAWLKANPHMRDRI